MSNLFENRIIHCILSFLVTRSVKIGLINVILAPLKQPNGHEYRKHFVLPTGEILLKSNNNYFLQKRTAIASYFPEQKNQLFSLRS